MLLESKTKSIDDRLGNSPEKIEKKVASKKGANFVLFINIYEHFTLDIFMTLTITSRLETNNIAI